MATLCDYVDSLPSMLRSLNDSGAARVTTGNQSCDLDSVACALAYSHFLYRSNGSPVLPLLQCSRDDLALRRDVVWLLQQLNLDPSKLVFNQDVKQGLGRAVSLEVTLVDHTHLTGYLLELPNVEVVSVIDHHVEEVEREGGRGGGEGGGEGRECHVVRDRVGSCATLVAEILLGNSEYDVEASVATLLLAAILVDTVNLSTASGRVTEKDQVVAGQLASLSVLPPANLYCSLTAARMSVEGLTTGQLLRKDFKIAEASSYRLGFSSVTCLISELLDRESVVEDIGQFCHSHQLSLLLLLGISIAEEEARRQVAVFQPLPSPTSPDLADSIASVLEAEEELQCQRQERQSFPGHLLEQGNTQLSRKHILPLVLRFVSSVEQENSATGVIQDEHTASSAKTATVAVLSVGEPVIAMSTNPTADEDAKKKKVSLIPEYTQQEENEALRTHRHVCVGGEEMNIDLLAIDPYKKIIQHGGYMGAEHSAVVVISSCYLPPHSLPDYHQLINHLFFYVLSIVERLVVDNYIIVYLHSGAPHNSMPSIAIFNKFYKMVDRRLRKQLKHLYIVHPTFWVKTMLRLARPFISGKFYRKVHFVRSLASLPPALKLDPHLIPGPVQRADTAVQPRPPQEHYKPSPLLLPPN